MLCGKINRIEKFRPCALRSRTVNRLYIDVKEIINQKQTTYSVSDDPQDKTRVCHFDEKLWKKVKALNEQRKKLAYPQSWQASDKMIDAIASARKQ